MKTTDRTMLELIAGLLVGLVIAALVLLATMQYHEKTIEQHGCVSFEGFTYSWEIEYVQIRHEGNKVEYLDKDGNVVLVRFK